MTFSVLPDGLRCYRSCNRALTFVAISTAGSYIAKLTMAQVRGRHSLTPNSNPTSRAACLDGTMSSFMHGLLTIFFCGTREARPQKIRPCMKVIGQDQTCNPVRMCNPVLFRVGRTKQPLWKNGCTEVRSIIGDDARRIAFRHSTAAAAVRLRIEQCPSHCFLSSVAKRLSVPPRTPSHAEGAECSNRWHYNRVDLLLTAT